MTTMLFGQIKESSILFAIAAKRGFGRCAPYANTIVEDFVHPSGLSLY